MGYSGSGGGYGGASDHGFLSGLADDDHALYQVERWVDVIREGAIGDGVADDTAAIAAAIASAGVGGQVHFPPGYTFKTGALTPLRGQTWWCYGATIRSTTAGANDFLEIAGDADQFRIHGGQFHDDGGATGWFLDLSHAAAGVARDVTLRDMEVSGFEKGIRLYNSIHCSLENLRINGPGKATAGGVGIKLGEAGAGGNGAVLMNCYVNNFESAVINYGGHTRIYSPIWEGNGTALVNHGTFSCYHPWLSSTVGTKNDLDFDFQNPGLVLGVGSSSWNMSFVNTTVQARSIIIPERNDRTDSGAGEGIALGPFLITTDGGTAGVLKPRIAASGAAVDPTALPAATTAAIGAVKKSAALAADGTAALTDNTGEVADAIIAQVDVAFGAPVADAGVDTINRANLNTDLSDLTTILNARLDLCNKNFSDIAAQVNALRSRVADLITKLQTAGVQT